MTLCGKKQQHKTLRNAPLLASALLLISLLYSMALMLVNPTTAYGAGQTRQVTDWDEFEAALNDPNVAVIDVQDTIGDSVVDNGHDVSISRSIEITSTVANTESEQNEIWYTWFTVKSGATLTLSGNVSLNADRSTGSVFPAIDPITVESGGNCIVKDNTRISTNNGTGGEDEGICIKIASGGSATINTSSTVHGSSGAIWNKGSCTIQRGLFGTENNLEGSFFSSGGHAAIHNQGSLIVDSYSRGSTIIDSLQNDAGATAVISTVSFEKREDFDSGYNSIPIFNNNGTVYLENCSFNDMVHESTSTDSEGNTYVFAPEGTSTTINGNEIALCEPTATWKRDENGTPCFSAWATVSPAPVSISSSTNAYFGGSGSPFSTFAEFRNVITSPDTPTNTATYSNGRLSTDNLLSESLYFYPRIDLSGEVGIDSGTFMVFGATAPLNLVDVDVNWGNMSYNINTEAWMWDPVQHTYQSDKQTIAPESSQAALVTITVNESPRPLGAWFEFSGAADYASLLNASFKVPNTETEITKTNPLELNGQGTSAQLVLEIEPGQSFPYPKEGQWTDLVCGTAKLHLVYR